MCQKLKWNYQYVHQYCHYPYFQLFFAFSSYSHIFLAIPGYSKLFQAVPAHSCLFLAIPSYFTVSKLLSVIAAFSRLFTKIPGYSKLFPAIPAVHGYSISGATVPQAKTDRLSVLPQLDFLFYHAYQQLKLAILNLSKFS